MKQAFPIFIIGIIGILLLDSLGSVASRRFNFNYAKLILINWPFIIAVAYFIAERSDRETTLIYVSMLGLFDATIGWLVSTALKANTGLVKPPTNAAAIIKTICIVIIMYALLGLLGWWMAKKNNI